MLGSGHWLLACVASLSIVVSCGSDESKKHARDGSSGEQAGGQAGTAPDPAQPGGAAPEGGTGGTAGGSAVLTDGWLSGTRLRAVLNVAGSARLFHSWRDTERDVDCLFGVDSDGAERCLPTTLGSFAYMDELCTNAVAVFSEGQLAPYVADGAYQFECGVGPDFVQVGAEITAPALFNDYGDGNGCVPIVLGETDTVYEAGAVVPNTAFVAATGLEQEPRDARLQANVRVAADGSRQVVSHLDVGREVDCSPRRHEGDGYACIPDDKAYIQYHYSDATCETFVAYHPGYAQQTCSHPPAIVQNSQPYFTDSYFEVGALFEGPVFRPLSGCQPYDAPASLFASYYTVGEPVEFTEFPLLASSNEGAGRIKLHLLRGEADDLIAREEFFDSELDTACYGNIAGDLKQRCLPVTPYGANQFTDDACTNPVFTTAPEEPLATGTFLVVVTEEGGQAIYRLAEKIDPPAEVYGFNGLNCELSFVLPNQDYYATTLVPAANLVEVTTEVE